MSARLHALRQTPWALLLELEQLLRAARSGAESAQAPWTGLAVRVGERWLAVPREDVAEVAPPMPATRVPGAKPWLVGIANLRGSLLPICDMAMLLGTRHGERPPTARILVCRAGADSFGFLVDEVAGQRSFLHSERRDALAASDTAAEFLDGAFVRDGTVWPVLGLRRTMASDTFRHPGV